MFVRAIHDAHPIRQFARIYFHNPYLTDQDAADYADTILLILGTLALEKVRQLDSYMQGVIESEVKEFLISARADGFLFASGVFRDSKGNAINADRLWDLSSPRPSSSRPNSEAAPTPAAASAQAPTVQVAASRKPPQPARKSNTVRDESSTENSEKTSTAQEKNWWERPVGIVVIGIFVTVIGGLILWAITRRYDHETASSLIPVPATQSQPQPTLPETKAEETRKTQSPKQKDKKEKSSAPTPKIQTNALNGTSSYKEPENNSGGALATMSQVVVQDQSGSPIAGVEVLFVSPNGTHTPIALTDETGLVRTVKPASKSVDIYCGHKKFSAFYKAEYDPLRPITIHLTQVPGVGSLVRSGEGYIELPGLEGGFDPRTYPSNYPNAGEHYAYVKNLSVNGQAGSLFPLKLHEEIAVEDNLGHRLQIILVAAKGESFLFQYHKP